MISLEEESKLITAVKAGDTKSFETLERNSRDKVNFYVCGLLKDELEAEDIYQQGLIKAWTKIDLFRGECRFSTWLCGICRNLAYDLFREKKRNRTEPLEEALLSGALSEASKERTAVENLETKEMGERIDRSISRLSPKHKIILNMLVKNNMSYLDISKSLKIAEGTVMSRIFHARKYAQKYYREEKMI